jgi:hypothetical protein
MGLCSGLEPPRRVFQPQLGRRDVAATLAPPIPNVIIGGRMSETEQEQEPTEPTVTDVPEPDQEPHGPEADEEAEEADEAAQEPTEPTEPEGATQEVWEARFKYAERIGKTYRDKIEAKWEEDALFLVPFNLDDAAPMGYIDQRNVGRVSDETRDAVLTFLGFSGGRKLNKDPYSTVCVVCDGEGFCDTGSKVPNMGEISCWDCKGKGWMATDERRSSGQVAAPTAPNGDQAITVPNATGPETPEIEALRLQGYMVVPPLHLPD